MAYMTGKEITTTSKESKEGGKHCIMLGWKNKNKTTDESNNATGRGKSKDISEVGKLKTY